MQKYNKGNNKALRVLTWKHEGRRNSWIVPFLGVIKALLSKPNTSPPCGAGTNSFAIATDGRVLACPIAPEFKWNVLGDMTCDPKD